MAEGFAYHKTVQRIPKKDLFICLALWMEESPLASSLQESESSDDFCYVSSSLGDKRKHVGLDAEQDKKKLKVLLEEDSRCNDTEGLANQVFPRPVSNQTTNDCVVESPMKFSNEESESLVIKELGEDSKLNTLGVVIVDSNEHIVAIDYSHGGLHAIANTMVVHAGKVQGCVVYTSRKPCSLCTKFMIQMGITRINYLPLEPECPSKEDLNNCEKMYRAGAIAQSVYVPTISESIVKDSSVKRSPYTPMKEDDMGLTQVLLNKHWTEEWINVLPQVLFWPDFTDISCKVSHQMTLMFEWLGKVTFADVPESTRFKPFGLPDGLLPDITEINNHTNNGLINGKISIAQNYTSTLRWQKIALHMSRMAQILSQRSDDPMRGVGAVVLKENEIVAIGWNGFPSKALYGDFPRANDRDESIKEKKYPFIIHAEQSTILSRLVQDIDHTSTTMFVNKMPCDECTPIILKVGIRNVVFPPERMKKYKTFLKTDLIMKHIATGKLKGFVSEICTKNEVKVDQSSLMADQRSKS